MGRSEFRKQDESLVTFAPKLTSKDGHIDWTRSSEEIRNLVRGLTPRPGSFTMFKEKRLEILETSANIEYRSLNIESHPGQVVDVDKSKGPVISTGDGALVLLKVKPQGKKEMSGQEFLRGYRLDTGEQLT